MCNSNVLYAVHMQALRGDSGISWRLRVLGQRKASLPALLATHTRKGLGTIQQTRSTKAIEIRESYVTVLA